MNRIFSLMFVLTAVAFACSLNPGGTSSATDTPVPTGTALVGGWQAVDIVDGSSMTLTVEADAAGNLTFKLFDDGATACGGTPLYAFDSSGHVIALSATEFSFDGAGKCAVTEQEVSYTINMTYDPATDTLIESSGQSWTR